MQSCPLCSSKDNELYFKDRKRKYYQCSNCKLLFVPKVSFLSIDEEKERYETHNNDPYESGYQTFLMKLLKPFSERLTTNMKGLDFGCGPTKTAEVLLGEKGINLNSYDPIFFPVTEYLNETYDFIVASEVVEHFCDPAKDWERMFSMLKAGGTLGVMTSCYPALNRFKLWRYKDDYTHVSFHDQETLQWLAARFKRTLEQVSPTVFFFS